MKTVIKKVFFLLVFFLCFSTCYAKKKRTVPAEVRIIKHSYPDLKVRYSYDKNENDWILTFSFPDDENKLSLYWCNGSLLPKEALKYKEKYWTLLYDYPEVLQDPSDMTEEEKESLKEFTTAENRKNGAGTPPFFFDWLYSADTQASLEKQLVQVSFLGKKSTVHKRIKEPLKNVEEKILALSKTDDDVKKFIDNFKSADAYYWRMIAGTHRKSFHSYGIAIDIIPKRYTGEAFWSWARDHNPSGWILTPLNRRWLPAKKVVEAFESEGFIWGGKWAIWDNMHFEYHPEIIKFNKKFKWRGNK